MKLNFARGAWAGDELLEAYSFRFTEIPGLKQADDCIFSDVNPTHREGFDNISFLTKETFSAGAKARLVCAFEDLGCPEIILVPEYEKCDDGALRYGACFEAVLYKDGINIWRHYREDGKCFWHRRLGLYKPVSEGVKHELRLEVSSDELLIELDGWQTMLHVDDLPERFRFGITMCEGIARCYEFEVEG